MLWQLPWQPVQSLFLKATLHIYLSANCYKQLRLCISVSCMPELNVIVWWTCTYPVMVVSGPFRFQISFSAEQDWVFPDSSSIDHFALYLLRYVMCSTESVNITFCRLINFHHQSCCHLIYYYYVLRVSLLQLWSQLLIKTASQK